MVKGGKMVKVTTAPESQAMLTHIIQWSEQKGKVVNDSKNGVICVSGATSFQANMKLEGKQRGNIGYRPP